MRTNVMFFLIGASLTMIQWSTRATTAASGSSAYDSSIGTRWSRTPSRSKELPKPRLWTASSTWRSASRKTTTTTTISNKKSKEWMRKMGQSCSSASFVHSDAPAGPTCSSTSSSCTWTGRCTSASTASTDPSTRRPLRTTS